MKNKETKCDVCVQRNIYNGLAYKVCQKTECYSGILPASVKNETLIHVIIGQVWKTYHVK